MRHSQLRAFHYVAHLGGFSRAAEFLLLTQPAISEQVRKLEQDHDVLLFHRERKRVRLTKQGAHLFRFTKQYFETEQQIEEYLSATSAAVDGELRIIADSAHHVTFFLGQFRKRFPNISVTLRTGNTDGILENLRAYNAEIGIVGGLPPGSDMETLDLGSTEITAFASREFSIGSRETLSMKELSGLPLVFREGGSKTRQKLEEEAKKQGIDYELAKFPWAASGRAISMAREEGMTKLLFDKNTRRILGAGIVGVNAGELISEAILALEMGTDMEDICLTIHPHPTLSETTFFAAEMAEGTITDLYIKK